MKISYKILKNIVKNLPNEDGIYGFNLQNDLSFKYKKVKPEDLCDRRFDLVCEVSIDNIYNLVINLWDVVYDTSAIYLEETNSDFVFLVKYKIQTNLNEKPRVIEDPANNAIYILNRLSRSTFDILVESCLKKSSALIKTVEYHDYSYPIKTNYDYLVNNE